MIDVVLLGTAALMPLPERALTAAVWTVKGRSLLVDCGEGTQTALRRFGVSPLRVDIIALTHYHGDHIFGLPGLLQTLSSLGRTDPLTLTGPLGLREAMAPILTLTGRVDYEIRLLPLPPQGLALNELHGNWPAEARLRAFPTEHRVPSQGYCFTLGRAGRFLPEKARALGVPTKLWSLLQRGQSVQAGERTVQPGEVLGPRRRGLKFAFSGDTAPCESLVKAAQDADLLICEATYGEDAQAQLAIDHGHMNFSQAAEMAARAGVRRLWLAHYSQMVEDPLEYLDNARTRFENAECGQDGMSVRLEFPE